jgi:uncharacterized RDD family membrane protein YckC
VAEVAKAVYVLAPTVRWGGTPGELIAGLRIVDGSSGAAIDWRQASVRCAAGALPRLLLVPLIRALVTTQSEAMARAVETRRGDLLRLSEELAGDEDALDRAAAALMEELGASSEGVWKVPAVLAGTLAASAISFIWMIRDRWQRTVRDRVAGTVVIRSSAT